jgi:hypothetical protein
VLRRLFSHATALRGHPDFLNRSCPERSEGAAAQCRAERFEWTAFALPEAGQVCVGLP